MAADKVEADYEELKSLFKHHIDSYNHMLEHGLVKAVRRIDAVEVTDSRTKLKMWFGSPEIYPPQRTRGGFVTYELTPSECRLEKLTYGGSLMVELNFKYGDKKIWKETINFGNLPIMVKSKRCCLRGKYNPKELVLLKEEPSEMGGYFIMNGVERVIRPLMLPKRNYPMSMVQTSFREKEGFTDKAVVMRCVKEDQSAVTVTLNYLTTDSARLGFRIQGKEHSLPVGIILKALTEKTDRDIYATLACGYKDKHGRGKGSVDTQLLDGRAQIILEEPKRLYLYTRIECLQYIGKQFQSVMVGLETQGYTDVADALLRDYIFVHLDNNLDKFNLLIVMLWKLFSLVDQTSVPDNPDSLQNQEVLLPGHLITIYLKEKLQGWLLRVKRRLQGRVDKNSKEFKLNSQRDVWNVIGQMYPKQIGLDIEYMLKTGNLNTCSSQDLQQKAGMTVKADRSKFLRFISHFRAVHRGASFAKLPATSARNFRAVHRDASFAKLPATSARKLVPESWGFLCPVHTPDGEHCGLLNHMTSSCRVTSYYDSGRKVKDRLALRKSILNVLVGMKIGIKQKLPELLSSPPEELYVLLDGRVLGSIASDIIEQVVRNLRRLKVSKTSDIPEDLEVGYVPLSIDGAYPGLYLFTSPSRFVRPVRNILIHSEASNNIELIGPFEQVYMEISCPDGGNGGRKNFLPATHAEVHPTGIFSVVANLTPWFNHNQSLLNLYQCQMAKQTMGFSGQALSSRADQKLYHLQTPQTPIVRTETYKKYNIDDYPQGTNAVVAVLSYTGYDMMEGMVLNKSSVERGMCRGYIYQTETIDLTKQKTKSINAHHLTDSDGLPFVGQRISPKDPYYSISNEATRKVLTNQFLGSDPVYVDNVVVTATATTVKNEQVRPQKANIRLRHPREPEVGDRFSTRHGQKATCAMLYQDIDMHCRVTK